MTRRRGTFARMTPPAPAPSRERPYRPMAIGFHLLALPLFVAIFLADDAVGRWTDFAAGAAMVAIGVVLQRLERR